MSESVKSPPPTKRGSANESGSSQGGQSLDAGELPSLSLLSGPSISRDQGTGPVFRKPAISCPQIEGYEVFELIGQGGMGSVWRARQLGANREVALKLMSPHLFGSGKNRRRFQREVELAAGLDHPGIVRVYETGLEGGVYYYAMQLINGVTLSQHDERTKPGTRQVLKLIREVCDAVAHAHRKGVIHRDLKPSNILIDREGRPHVVDFGLAKSMLEDQHTESLEGDVAGTLAYMSPEQALGDLSQLDTGTDVYALGVILYQLLAGRLPHPTESSTPPEILRRISEDPVPRPRQWNKEIDSELETVLMTALAKEPEVRYANAAELGRDLQRYLDGDPLAARPPSFLYYMSRRVRQHRRAIAWTGAVALMLVGVVMIYQLRIWESRREQAVLKSRLDSTLEQVGQSQKQIDEMAKAVEKEMKVSSQLTRSAVVTAVMNGWTHARQGDAARALHWFIRALEREKDPSRQDIHRMRIAAQLQKYPRLIHLGWVLEPLRWGWSRGDQRSDLSDDCRFDDSGRYLLARSERGHAIRVHDASTGRILQPRLHHQYTVADTAVSRDGRYLMVATGMGGGSGDRADHIGEVVVWDLRTGRQAYWPLKHWGMVRTVALNQLGTLIATGDSNGVARVWNAATGEPVTGQLQHPGGVTMVRFDPAASVLVTACGEGVSKGLGTTVSIWDARSGDRLARRTFDEHIKCIEIDPEANEILIIHPTFARRWVIGDGTRGRASDRTGQRASTGEQASGVLEKILRWALPDYRSEAGSERASTTSDDWLRGLSTLRANPAGSGFAYAGRSGVVGLIGVAGSVDGEYQLDGDVSRLAFSPDGRFLLAVSRKRQQSQMLVFDLANHQLLRRDLHGVSDACFARDGRYLRVLSSDTLLELWDLRHASGDVRSIAYEPGARVRHLAFSPGGRFAAMAVQRNRVSGDASGSSPVDLWDLRTGYLLAEKLKNSSEPVFSSDARWLATQDHKHVMLWSTATDTSYPYVLPHESAVEEAVFSADAKMILTRTHKSVSLWETQSGNYVFRDNHRKEKILDAAVGRDGRFLAVVEPTELRVYDITQRELWCAPQRQHPYLESVVFHPEGDRLLSTHSTGKSVLWDLRQRPPVAYAFEHGGEVEAADFSPDGRFFFTSGYEGGESPYTRGASSVRIWSTQEHASSPPLGHEKRVSYAAFSADSSHLLTITESDGHEAGSVRLWQAATGALVRDPVEHVHPAGVSFRSRVSGDGRLLGLVAVNERGKREARVWEIPGMLPVIEGLTHTAGAKQIMLGRDNRHVVTVGYGGRWDRRTDRHAAFPNDEMRLWNLSKTSSTLASLGRVAQLVTGVSLTEGGVSVPLSPTNRLALWGRLKAGLGYQPGVPRSLAVDSSEFATHETSPRYIVAESADPAVRGWVDRLNDADAAVRQKTIDRLAKMGHKAHGAIPALVAATRDSDRFVAGAAILALTRVCRDPSEVLPALVEALIGARGWESSRLDFVAWKGFLKEPDPGGYVDVVDAAVAALGDVGRPALEAVLGVLDSPYRGAHPQAIEALRLLGSQNPDILNDLCASSDAGRRALAAKALLRVPQDYPQPDGVPLLRYHSAFYSLNLAQHRDALGMIEQDEQQTSEMRQRAREALKEISREQKGSSGSQSRSPWPGVGEVDRKMRLGIGLAVMEPLR